MTARRARQEHLAVVSSVLANIMRLAIRLRLTRTYTPCMETNRLVACTPPPSISPSRANIRCNVWSIWVKAVVTAKWTGRNRFYLTPGNCWCHNIASYCKRRLLNSTFQLVQVLHLPTVMCKKKKIYTLNQTGSLGHPLMIEPVIEVY